MIVRHRGLALVLMLAAALAACSEETAGGPGGPGGGAPPQVGYVTLKPEPVPLTVEVAGRTAAFAVADIRPRVDGIVRRRVFTEGAEVKAGDLLYEIDPRTYQAAYDAAEAALEKANGALPSAQAKVDRYNQLVGANSVTAQNLDDAKASLAQAKADVAAAEASVEAARINLDFTKVTAPIAGRIGTSAVTEGALVTANQTTALATIRQIDPIYVDLSDSTANLLRFRSMRQSGLLQVDGPPSIKLILEDGSTYSETGTLETMDAAVSQTTDTFTIRSVFRNPDSHLLPGMYARAVITVGTAKDGFLVPQRAVDRNAKGAATAKFLTADDKIETRILDTIQAVGTNWLVLAGIRDGDRLVVDGLQRIRDGESVKPVAVTIDAAGIARTAEAATAKPATQEGTK